jgi:putative FmdB family regulatory protein
LPTYEYECTRCHHVFEEFRSITAPRRQRCPQCRGKVERLISGGSGIVFRGSGFYVTDSRKSSRPAATREGGSSDSGKKKDGASTPAAESSSGSEKSSSDSGSGSSS